MLMATGQKDPHEMAELYSRRIQEADAVLDGCRSTFSFVDMLQSHIVLHASSL